MKLCPVCSTEYPDDVRFCKNDGSALRALAPAADLVGQIVADRYHVIRKLGEGGMGQVYLAEHVKMGRKSAIKVMNPAMAHDPDALARFNREAANASRITHPHVCAIYDFGETPDGIIYLAMEFVEGEPLADVLEREGALPPERAAGIFLQTADALQAAHDLGIVHRDLKPDNIMLARGRDGRDVVKVVDFGIAKAVGAGGAGSAGGPGEATQKVTKTGLVIGTPEFMSPEQLSGDPVDGRSDLYALALVLFKMLTGKLPFEAETVQETMIQRLTDEPRTLVRVRPDLAFPPGLQSALDAALTRAPADRYQTVTRFATDVEQVLGLAAGAPAVPSTPGDVDVKTQMLDAPGARAPAARTTPLTRESAPAAPNVAVRKRSLTPVVIGAVVILGAGAAGWAMVHGGGTRSPDSVALARPDTAAGPARPLSNRVPPGGERSRETRTRQGPTAEAFDSAAVKALLYRLIEASPRVIVDSATLVFEMRNVAAGDRAFAACLRAQAQRDLGDARDALVWARRGLALNPTLASCRQVVGELAGEPE